MDYTTSKLACKHPLTAEVQGRVVQLKVRREQERSVTWVRGKVQDFSRKSRRRMLDLCNRVAPQAFINGRVHFFTVTYPSEVGHKSWQEAKRDFHALWKRLERFSNLPIGCIWREDYQKRGEPHFHLIVFGLPYFNRDMLRHLWCEVIGYHHPNQQVDVQKVQNYRHLVGYVGKYMCKVQDHPRAEQVAEALPAADQACLDLVPYLAAVEGRVWGVRGKEVIPWAELMRWAVTYEASIRRVLRVVRRHPAYKKVKGAWRGPGLSLWTDYPGIWAKLIGYMEGLERSILEGAYSVSGSICGPSAARSAAG